ncbi:hypothetical protein RQP46_001697 [Phenoliferia psychrophenolica]
MLFFFTSGLILSMGWGYFRQFPNDHWLLKSVVAIGLVLTTFDTALSGAWNYRMTVEEYCQPAALTLMPM